LRRGFQSLPIDGPLFGVKPLPLLHTPPPLSSSDLKLLLKTYPLTSSAFCASPPFPHPTPSVPSYRSLFCKLALAQCRSNPAFFSPSVATEFVGRMGTTRRASGRHLRNVALRYRVARYLSSSFSVCLGGCIEFPLL